MEGAAVLALLRDRDPRLSQGCLNLDAGRCGAASTRHRPPEGSAARATAIGREKLRGVVCQSYRGDDGGSHDEDRCRQGAPPAKEQCTMSRFDLVDERVRDAENNGCRCKSARSWCFRMS